MFVFKNLEFRFTDHPPYSPYFAPSIFCYQTLKGFWKGENFQMIQGVFQCPNIRISFRCIEGTWEMMSQICWMLEWICVNFYGSRLFISRLVWELFSRTINSQLCNWYYVQTWLTNSPFFKRCFLTHLILNSFCEQSTLLKMKCFWHIETMS